MHLRDRLERYASWVLVLLFAGMSLLLLTELCLSLRWRMEHDSPLMHYVAFSIDRFGDVPYRDLFDLNFPGVFLLHLAIGRTLGYGDLAFRIVDLLYVVSLAGLTWRLARPFGRRVVWGATLLFPLHYLSHGPEMSLQRDTVAILPIVAGTVVATAGTERHRQAARALFAGGLFGLAGSLKPHLAIGLPIVLVYMCLEARQGSTQTKAQTASMCLAAVGGMLLVALGPFVWVAARGGFTSFVEVLTRYAPLYLRLSGTHQALAGAQRVAYLVSSYVRGVWLLALPALLGWWLCRRWPGLVQGDRRRIDLLAAMAVAYSVGPLLAGQFWSYHWMPWVYFALLCAALLLSDTQASVRYGRQLAAAAVAYGILVLWLVGPAPGFRGQLRGLAAAPPKSGRPDEIAAFLRANMQPGDTVQPLDWTGGAVHGMLLAEARLATRYIYDYHFYHHVSSPVIQSLRADFLLQLQGANPRFVVRVTERPWPTGPDTTTEFPELEAWLARLYRPDQRGDGYVIYQLQTARE